MNLRVYFDYYIEIIKKFFFVLYLQLKLKVKIQLLFKFLVVSISFIIFKGGKSN